MSRILLAQNTRHFALPMMRGVRLQIVTSAPKRQRVRPRIGDVFAIQIGPGELAFGQVCEGYDHAFFDLKAAVPPALDTIVGSPVAFRVPVARDAISAGGWKIIGNAPLKPELARAAAYYHRPVGAARPFRYSEGRSEPVAESEVEGLEVLATWFSDHVVQRLRHHFAGTKDPNLASLRYGR